MNETNTFLLDGEDIPFTPGQSIIQAATAHGIYIPHLCWHPEFKAHGSCKICTVKVNGRFGSSCRIKKVFVLRGSYALACSFTTTWHDASACRARGQ